MRKDAKLNCPYYLDNAATTKMSEKCAQVMQNYACEAFYNPSAGYGLAISVAKEMATAKKSLLNKLGAAKGDIIFTGGATESNNLAILGSLRNGNWEYVFSAGEHPSVYNVALHLKQLGFIVHIIPLQVNGQVDYEALEKVLNEKTRLISVMHVSNETGAINDLVKINNLRNKYCPKALFHSDGVQAFCKLLYNLDSIGVDLYSISAHKFHGPKGVGALYVKNKQALKNIIYGGGQEGGLRSGTENMPGIMAMVAACNMAKVKENYEHVKAVRKSFLDVFINEKGVSFIETDSPFIVSVSFTGVNGETLMRVLENKVIVSTGSACSAKYAGNRILQEIGLSVERIKSSIRVSFDTEMSEDEAAQAGGIILHKYQELREKVK